MMTQHSIQTIQTTPFPLRHTSSILHTMNYEEEVLCQLAKNGDRDACATLCERYRELIEKIANWRAGHGVSVEDLVQEGFVLMIEEIIPRYDPTKGTFNTYFNRVWGWRSSDAIKRQQKGSAHISLDALDEKGKTLHEKIAFQCTSTEGSAILSISQNEWLNFSQQCLPLEEWLVLEVALGMDILDTKRGQKGVAQKKKEALKEVNENRKARKKKTIGDRRFNQLLSAAEVRAWMGLEVYKRYKKGELSDEEIEMLKYAILYIPENQLR